MDFIITLLKWIAGLTALGFIFFAASIIIIKEMEKRELKRSSFPCTYISGMCTKKPTYDNCKFYGSVPEHVCEDKLNRKKKL